MLSWKYEMDININIALQYGSIELEDLIVPAIATQKRSKRLILPIFQ